MNDLRFALRSLARSPAFTAVAVLTLAIGIGVSVTIFNCANPLLFRSLPFRDPDTLVFLGESNLGQGGEPMSVSYADFTHWQKENHVLSDLGIWDTIRLSLGTDELPENVSACAASARLFATLGLAPAVGRGFAVGEDQPGAAPVAILSDGLWRRRFSGDPKIVGRDLMLNGRAHTVIGVMPPGLRFPNDTEVWVPLVVEEPEKTHGNFTYASAGRLKPGVTRAQADADLAGILARVARETPTTNARIGARVVRIADGFLDDDLRALGWTMLVAVVFVLAVACANVASLFLARALGREKEFAVRASLGAGRWQMLRQLLVESLVLGTAAGGLGFLFSLWGLDLVLKLVPVEIPYWLVFSLDWRVLTFAAGVSVLTSVLFGLAPAWHVAGVNVLAGLGESARGGGGRRQQRLRSFFVVSEVALATLLLCGTGLMIRTVINLQRVNPGFNPSRLATFFVDLGTASPPPARAAFLSTFLEQLRGLPGVQGAAACSRPPLSGGATNQVFTIEGLPSPALGQNPLGNLRVITPGYFSTMEIPLVRGRDFAASDTATAVKVIILDAAFARQYFGDADPLGQRIRWSPADATSSREVVGVAADVKHFALDRESRPGFYIPLAQSARSRMGVVVRTTTTEPLGVISSVRRVLHRLDPALTLYNVRSMTVAIRETYWIRRYLGELMSGFAALALALAAVGIASVVAYSVTQRTHEIGIRMALGAQTGEVARLILIQGMKLVFAGLAIGMAASLALAHVLTSQLYGVGWIDPWSLLASAALFVIVALFASWLPARRATRINPVEALRAE